ncbi:prevent-host-death protein [Burkholderia sp. A9]|uniref:type II toxin-antitoxin system Phd/YefM family antitoxin n=1 Tax=Burkholderia TaxID=32008 RepID=UPI000573E3C9|nr:MULTISPECIES: hypothetical protein [Burkholderia]KHK59073.1 prevent-host-death protein [Burkholderia sp. A9]KUZ34864.1 prevent-host-death protein [Burkholderia territorii]KUZ59675.1 prevent-host-death protein [Burkholderia territorii]KVC15909.1 prevent-host-death protein [Burkholderia diffusa]
MEKRVSKATFKTKACELFRQVEMLGESVIVTDHGRPTIEIRRYVGPKRNAMAAVTAAIVHFDLDPIREPAES